MVVAFMFRVHLKKLIARVVSLKHGETEISFAEDSARLIKGEISGTEEAKLRERQVVSFAGNYNTGSGYRLYGNGTLSQRLQITARPGKRDVLVFPIAFPNEVTSIQIIGDIDGTIVEVTNANCTVAYSPHSSPTAGRLFVSGL